MDPHFWTLDRKFYGFMGRGQFVLTRVNSAGGQLLLEIQAEHTQLFGRHALRFGASATAVTRLTFGMPNTDSIFEVIRSCVCVCWH